MSLRDSSTVVGSFAEDIASGAYTNCGISLSFGFAKYLVGAKLLLVPVLESQRG